MNDELEPCPFCGKRPERFVCAKTLGHDYAVIYECKDAHHRVWCEADNDVDAIDVWNTRAESTAMLTYEYTEANGWRERLGRCQCGNLIEVAEFVGGGGNGDYMVVQSSPYCEMCGAKVVG